MRTGTDPQLRSDSLPLRGYRGGAWLKRSLARHLRRHPTVSEDTLWHLLRRRQLDGVKFRRQALVGAYVVDLYAPALRLAVEVDGPEHTAIDARAAHRRQWDAQRDRQLAREGVVVVRVTNDEVLSHPMDVLAYLRTVIARRAQSSSPSDARRALTTPPSRARDATKGPLTDRVTG